jgi:hypothetical protein
MLIGGMIAAFSQHRGIWASESGHGDQAEREHSLYLKKSINPRPERVLNSLEANLENSLKRS